jgi:hypothetical protein
MGWLEPPWRFFHPIPGVPFTLDVKYYQVGLAEREIEEPPGVIIRPTIRLYLAGSSVGLEGYVDFTNRGLTDQLTRLYDELIGGVYKAGVGEDPRRALALLPEGEEPLRLKLTRMGTGVDTRYIVELTEEPSS